MVGQSSLMGIIHTNFIMHHGLHYARLPYITAPITASILPVVHISVLLSNDLGMNINAVFLEFISMLSLLTKLS